MPISNDDELYQYLLVALERQRLVGIHAVIEEAGSPSLRSFLSTKWAPEPFTDLTPLDPGSEDRFVSNLDQVLREWGSGR
jgi:hypothetical protein